MDSGLFVITFIMPDGAAAPTLMSLKSFPLVNRKYNWYVYYCIFESMYTTEKILQILKAKKAELENRYPISELGLFGSYAKGSYTAASDIDILVDFNKQIGVEFIQLAHELEDIFHTKVDLVSRKGIKPRYLAVVEKNLIHV